MASNTVSRGNPSDICLFETFRAAVWGNEPVFKKSLSIVLDDKNYSIQYLDFGEQFGTLKKLCPVMKSKCMIVRDEYKHAMIALEEEQEEYEDGASILGQPGIGKTFFLIYALIERLRKQQPTAFQFYSDHYFLFTPEGVTKHPTTDQQTLWAWPGIWALSDSNDSTFKPADAFLTDGVRIIQAAPPETCRWQEWMKQYRAGIYIMDVWTPGELAALAGLDVRRMSRLAADWGPCPRTLLRMFKSANAELQFQSAFPFYVSEFVDSAGRYLERLKILDFPLGVTGPSFVVFIRPRCDADARVHRLWPEVYIPTDKIASYIIRTLLKREAIIRSQCFSAMSSYASMRSGAGYIFEQWVHTSFLSGVNVRCTWLNGLPESTLVSPGFSRPITTQDQLKHHDPPFYWCPEARHYPGIDAAIRIEDDVYAIQCTISNHHGSLQEGLEKLQKIVGKRRELSWKVLFVGTSLTQATQAAQRLMSLPDSSKKRKRENEELIPIGVCEMSLLGTVDEKKLDALLERKARTFWFAVLLIDTFFQD